MEVHVDRDAFLRGLQMAHNVVEPRQTLLAGEIAEQVGVRISEINPEATELAAQRFRRDFVALLIDDRTARLWPAKRLAGTRSGAAAGTAAPGTRGLGGINLVVRHRHQMVTRSACASCVTPSRRG